MNGIGISVAAAVILAAGSAQADVRICETTLTGPAGQHTIYIEMDGSQMVYGEAIWAPPRQNARANIDFPRIELNYGITDETTGARTSLRYVVVSQGVRTTGTRAVSAEVTLSPYTQEGERRDWPFFARARDPANTRIRNSDAIAGQVVFSSPAALSMAQTAPQLETAVITNLDERLASGVFLMTHRPALDALFDHAFNQLRPALSEPARRCRSPRHDERLRSE